MVSQLRLLYTTVLFAHVPYPRVYIIHKEETGLAILSPVFACVTNDVGMEGRRHHVTIFMQVGVTTTIQEMNGGCLPAVYVYIFIILTRSSLNIYP